MAEVNNNPHNEVADHVYMDDSTEAAIAELEGPVDLHRFDDDGAPHAG